MAVNQETRSLPPMIRYDRPFILAKRAEKRKNDFEMRRPQSAGDNLDRETRDLLNKILPPRCWIADHQVWKQMVSSLPATREDVIRLQEILDGNLHHAEARETGLCTVRRALYSECFDEVIRQVTLNCAERGVLLVRIRDEMEVTLSAYERMYCSAIGFGMRKALQTHIEKEILSDRVQFLEVSRDTMEEVIASMQKKFNENQQRAAELFAIEEKKFNEEMAFLKKAGMQLKLQIEGIMGPKK